MTKTKHIHKYVRRNLGKDEKYIVFACSLPSCTHFLPKRLAVGKLSICNRCEKMFILDRRAMKLRKPHCIDCVKSGNKENYDKLKEYLEAHDLVSVTDES